MIARDAIVAGEARVPDGWLPSVLTACAHKEEGVAKLLLDHSADARMSKSSGWTALMECVRQRHAPLTTLLLERGADVNQPTRTDGWSALHLAAKRNDETNAQQLLTAKASIDLPSNDGWTALMIGARNGHEQMVTLLLGARAAVGHAKHGSGHTALHAACQNGHAPVVTLLLRARASVDATRADDGWTSLMYACSAGHAKCAELCLDARANVDQRKPNGWTSLMAASTHGHTECVTLLLARNADATRVKDDGLTALSLAEEHAHLNVAKTLRDHLGLATKPDPLAAYSFDEYPSGRENRAAARVRRAASGSPGQRPQSAG